MIAAEWLKFRTVRGWVLATLVALVAVAGLGLTNTTRGSCAVAACTPVLGPGGEAVSDSFYFVGSKLTGDGTITARVSSLVSDVPSPPGGAERVDVPWAKAGIILKASLTQGSAYVAIMVTGSHGVRLQDDFTGDIAGPAMRAGWLRLTRSGTTITGYASSSGAAWTKVGTVRLPGLPDTAEGGMFVTSPQTARAVLGVASIDGNVSQSTATFDDVSVSWPAARLTGTAVGGYSAGPAAGPAVGYTRSGAQYTIMGAGDIAPATAGPNGSGVRLSDTLVGTFIALIILVVIGAMFVTAEYRRGLIRVTLAACPRRGRVLVAKACVVGMVAFAAGLVGAAVVVPLGQRMLREHGVYLPPTTTLTEIRVIVGTAAVLAACAVLAVAIGAIVRRRVTAAATVISLIVLPYLLAVTIPVVPLSVADWLMRLTPTAAFAVQQTVIQYPQVDEVYAPAYGYWPLPAWAGLAVLAAWTAGALALAHILLNRRDV
jgi:ABC-type transport system involved in multi-copper enzyme maturation permease subunit